MPQPGFFDSIARDLGGHGMFGGNFQFRLIIQPTVGALLGLRFGIRDAKQGRPPFFKALAMSRGKRGEMLAEVVHNVLVPLVVAMIIDSVLQHMINGHVRPVAALIIGSLLIFPPFLIVRGLVNRLWTRTHPGPGRTLKRT